jgi:hypothetical protein
MAKTAKRKRKPIAATGKRGRIVDLLDIAPRRTAKTPAELRKRKKRLQQFLRALLRKRHEGLKSDRALALPTLTPPAGQSIPSPNQRRKAGAKPKYDWDIIQAHCYQRFDDNGYPENVSAFCRDEIIPWCEQRYGEVGTPDMETMRPLVTKWIAAWQRSLLPK